MNQLYKKYFSGLFNKSGGFIPTQPINQTIYPGDFFQIRNGEMIVLGNIYQDSMINPADVSIEYGLKLNPVNWSFHDGVTMPFTGKGAGNNPLEGDFEFSKQLMSFESSGSFMFKGNNPESTKISNWNEIKDKLIIALTQGKYSFREVYIATECATNSEWTLAVAASSKAELEIASVDESIGLVNIFGDSSAKTIQSKDLEYYQHEIKRIPSFFKAKKLVVNDDKFEVFLNDHLNERINHDKWASDFYDSDFYHNPAIYAPTFNGNLKDCLLDMLPPKQLNPSTAMSYFRWIDANLDDIERLF